MFQHASHDGTRSWSEERNERVYCKRSPTLLGFPAITQYPTADLSTSVSMSPIEGVALTAIAAEAPNPLHTLPATIIPTDPANPHTTFHTRNHVDATCRTRTRPKTSDNGAQRSGPTAYASTYEESMSCMIASLGHLRSLAIVGNEGAGIVEVIMVQKEKDEARSVAVYLRCCGQV